MSLGDIPIKSNHLHVEGNETLVSGTAQVNRDLSSEFNWWKLRPRRSGSDRYVPSIPTDENGQPMRLCSRGHYEPRKNFYPNPGRPDKLDNYCKSCRKAQVREWRRQEAEQAGRVLRKQAGRPPKAAKAS